MGTTNECSCEGMCNECVICMFDGIDNNGRSDRERRKKTRVRIIIMLRFPEGHSFSPMGLWAEKKRAKITFTRDHHE